MSNFISFYYTSPANKKSLVSWDDLMNNDVFLSLEKKAPQFDCCNFEGIQVIEFSTLNIHGIVNKARSGGVDTNNINGILSEFRSRGYRVDKFPPVLVILPDGKIELWDGYNRYNASKLLEISSFPCAVYRLKEEWKYNLEDAYDQVSLGLNNHPQCKPATIQDFVNRGIEWVSRNGNSKTKDEIIVWVNSIDNSWTYKQVETIAKHIYHNTTVATTITPYPHPRTAQAWVSANFDNQESSTNPLVVCCKEDGYVERAFLQIMKNFVGNIDKKIDPIDLTELLLYTKNCESVEQVEKQRKFAIQYLTDIFNLVLDFADKVNEKSLGMETDYQPFIIKGSLPQLNGIEDLDAVVPITRNLN